MTEETKTYQLKLLFPLSLDKEKMKEIIKKIGEKPSSESNLVRQKLSYPIKKQSEGFSQTLDFILLPDSIKKIKNYLASEKNILRYMVIAKKAMKAKPREEIDLKMIDKIEPIKEVSKPKPKREKVKIEELDKKLKEILGQ